MGKIVRVLYDDQAFTMQHVGGVSKGICRILEQMPPSIDMRFGVSHCNNVYLRESGLVPDLQPARTDWIAARSKSYFPGKRTLFMAASRMGLVRSAEYYNRRLSVELLRGQDFDVFHPTFFDDYFLRYLGGKPFVLTIHDMMPELFPDYFRKDDLQIVAKRKLIGLASAIAVPSHNTKKDLMDMLGVPEGRITVIHRGGPPRETVTEPAIMPGDYFLFVGSRGEYKNFVGVLNDFSVFSPKYPDVRLVCVGTPFTPAEEGMINERNLSGRVIRKAADDAQLKNLYAHARAFIFPSRYEGFGLPVLESFAYGCPLLLNNRSCFPEVAGDAALYFESDGGFSDLPEKMRQVLEWTPAERTAAVDRGYARLSCFSWERAAAQYAELYSSLV